MAAICKIQDGGHIGIKANGNIVFLIAYTMKFPKMYSFDTLHKHPAKWHSEPDYCILFEHHWHSLYIVAYAEYLVG